MNTSDRARCYRLVPPWTTFVWVCTPEFGTVCRVVITSRGLCAIRAQAVFYTVFRLLAKAVNFIAVLPFVNPARAPLSTVKLEGRNYVVQGPAGNKFEGLNAVFLTTGIITECCIIKPASSWSPGGGQDGPAVKRVRLCPFAVEYGRTAAFLGQFLDIEKTGEFSGPVYNNGLAFTTRKEGARKGESLALYYPGMSVTYGLVQLWKWTVAFWYPCRRGPRPVRVEATGQEIGPVAQQWGILIN
jgi:hypothetical protein